MPRTPSTFIPDAQQTLLLRAALWRNAAGREAWQSWRDDNDLELLDPGSHRLLPLLYRNLTALGVDDPVMAKYKGVYRQTWYKNQLLFHRAVSFLRAAKDAGIDTLLLKGPALTLLYYRDYGLRPMDDFDALVHPRDAVAAMELLEKLGWTLKTRYVESNATLVPLRHGTEFVNEYHDTFDLHWSLFGENDRSESDDALWSAAVPLNLEGEPSLGLNPAALLVHVCAHGARWNPMPPVRWVADAIMIINDAETEVDWEGLLAIVAEHHLALPLGDTLELLREKFDCPIPPNVTEAIRRMPVTAREEREYAARIRPQRVWGYLPAMYYDYARRAKPTHAPQRWLGFARYLQYQWDVEHFWLLPVHFARRGVLRARKISQLSAGKM